MAEQVVDLGFYQSPECRELILERAFHLYTQRDFGSVSLNQVAQASELPTAVVAWHFASETKLHEEVLHRFFRRLLPRVLLASQRRLQQARRTFSAEEMIQTFFRALSRMLQRYGGLFSGDLRALFAAGIRDRQTTLFFELLEEFTPELAETIRQGQVRGRFNPDLDSRTGTTWLKSLVNGGTVQCVMFNPAEDPSYYFDRLCEQAMDLLLTEPDDWKRWAE